MMAFSAMSWLLAVQPDGVQADALREALAASVSGDVVVAQSIDEALASIDQSIPDVILLPSLMSVVVEDYLVAYLRAIPGTGHVQILGLPRLERSEPAVPPPARSLLSWQSLLRWPWRREPRAHVAPGCDPGVFARELIGHVAGARALKREIGVYGSYWTWNDTPERRREPRFAPDEVPWISLVGFGRERAALINVSSRGALLQTHARPAPHLLKRSGSNHREPHLTLGLHSEGEIVHATGRVIRCVRVTTGERPRYEVAFSFDEFVGLHLPATGALVPARHATEDEDGHRADAAAVAESSQRTTRATFDSTRAPALSR